IAYDNHDIDDGLRAGFLALEDLLTLDGVAEQWRAVERRYPAAPRERQLRELVRDQIGVMVNDVLTQTRAAIDAARIETAADVRAAGRALAGFSPAMAAQERVLKRFMYANLYHHPEQLAAAAEAERVVSGLFAAYCADPALMGQRWAEAIPQAEPGRSRHIADFIAGMTDRYATRAHAEICGKTALVPATP
ncbi:MAG: deoxyguanosinetriphosphate triphosphohydrolase, partial [Sphingobium sp.]